MSMALRTGSAPVCERVAQRLALEQFRDDVELAVVDARVEDRDDVRMRQRGDGLRLAFEARAALVPRLRSGRP